jgi:hypothetical protein
MPWARSRSRPCGPYSKHELAFENVGSHLQARPAALPFSSAPSPEPSPAVLSAPPSGRPHSGAVSTWFPIGTNFIFSARFGPTNLGRSDELPFKNRGPSMISARSRRDKGMAPLRFVRSSWSRLAFAGYPILRRADKPYSDLPIRASRRSRFHRAAHPTPVARGSHLPGA